MKKLAAAYPKSVICSNLHINGFDDSRVIPFTDYEQLKELSNAEKGIIFLIDEIHVLWNSLESKNIPISEMAVFAQMRKARRVIIGTSQVNGEGAKGEKDGELEGELVRTEWFFHRPEDYQAYDTFTKIERLERKKGVK